jgi:membrane-anchored glycerophosphoryl diester phosphodiesterase (GDPDase)
MLLFFAAMVYGVIIAMRLSLAFPASLAEGLTTRASLRRSGQLTRGAKGRIFLVLLVIYALGYAAEMVGFFVLAEILGVGALILMALHVQLASVVGIVAGAIAALCLFAFIFLWAALFWAAFSIAIAVLYHDQRLRIEGPPPAPLQPGEPA